MQQIFVFGSNLAGRHGAGSAKEAVNRWGAKYGVARGLTGSSYAIPTKDHQLKVLPLETITQHIKEFCRYAGTKTSDYEFLVVKVGCGLAGYSWERDIKPIFDDAIQKDWQNLDNIGEKPGYNITFI